MHPTPIHPTAKPNSKSQPDPIFFSSPAEFRQWLQENHKSASEVWVGFYKRSSGLPSITWPESVDEALCVGWIDGIRKSIDSQRYMIRFTPRKPGSVWSNVNVKRAQALIDEGRMQPAGGAAFDSRRENRSGVYSYENRPEQFDEPYLSRFKQNPDAWQFFSSRSPSYRRSAIWWVITAKQEETRHRRLNTLIELSNRQETLPQLTPTRRSK